MYEWLTQDDCAEALRVLEQRLTARQMRDAVDRDVERLVASVEHRRGNYSSRVPDGELAGFLVDLYGVDLLARREVRQAVVDAAGQDEIDLLYQYGAQESGRKSRQHRIAAIVDRRWAPGKQWPRYFARLLGFPPVFAGIAGSPEGPSVEEVEPHIPLPSLHDYQEELLTKTLAVLSAPAGQNRAILSLPTGAGKTRTAVEALLQWWDGGSAPGSYILWIAQSDELCEQALEAFREVWVDRGGKGMHQTLRLHRCWGMHRALPEAFSSGVIVASIQKLYEFVDQGQNGELAAMAEDLAAVAIDEAHHALAPSYSMVLRLLGVLNPPGKPGRVPLLGLTATPYRGQNIEENHRLAQRFDSRLLIPTLPGDDPLRVLRERGVLAMVDHREVNTGQSYELSDAELQVVESQNRFPDAFLRRVGEDPRRNQLLLDELLALPAECPILFFGCSVDHASAMAVLLRRKGRRVAVVVSTTRRATRRHLIEEFRAGRIQILSNYGVLTTGFDAPQIQAVVIARPTTSVVLYEQMIGRGMRGPRNGGTPRCLIIDLVDNIRRFQGQMAYARMQEYWQ